MSSKFVIERSSLNNMTDMAAKAVAKKTTNPILSGIKIEVSEDKKLHLYATDLQTGFHGALDLESLDGLSQFVVDQKVFSDIIKNLQDNTIEFEFENGVLMIGPESSRFRIPTMDGQDFPKVIPNVSGASMEIEKDLLVRMIDKVMFCALKESDPLSKNLNGIYWDFGAKGYFRMVATDSYRLGLYETSVSEDLMFSSFLLSLKSMEELKNVLDGSKTDKITLNFDGSRVLFTFNDKNIELVLNVVDARYPNYVDILPRAFKVKLNLATSTFLTILKRAAIAAGRTDQIKIDINDQIMTVSANSPEVGEIKETHEIEKDGEDLLMGYNPRYLREAIEKVETTDFEFNISGEVNPTIIKPNNDNTYMYIVMPSKIY